MKFTTTCTIQFQYHVDRTKVGEMLVALGMKGIEGQLRRSSHELVFASPEAMQSALEIIDDLEDDDEPEEMNPAGSYGPQE